MKLSEASAISGIKVKTLNSRVKRLTREGCSRDEAIVRAMTHKKMDRRSKARKICDELNINYASYKGFRTRGFDHDEALRKAIETARKKKQRGCKRSDPVVLHRTRLHENRLTPTEKFLLCPRLL